MPPITPNAEAHANLAPLASRLVDVATMPWTPSRWPGIHLKVLMEDKDTGLLTALTKFDKGAVLPDHEHVELEQTFVLEGSLVDDDGEVTPGQYVWRPGGSRHTAHSPNGCVVLSFFLKPNKFFD
ncbi:MAG: cupin domain-containing protein [Hyphomicrobiaceae bacterium]